MGVVARMKELLLILIPVLLVARSTSQSISFPERDILKCSSESVPSGTCQVIARCPQLMDEQELLPIREFVRRFGGCGLDGNGNLMVCCPVESAQTDSSCSASSVYVKGLGCITAMTSPMTWAEAKDNCVKQGSRLLQGIATSRQLRQLREHFESIISFGNEHHDVWLGITQGRWSEGGTSSPPEHFWYPGQPTAGGSDCGYIALQMETPTFWDTVCEAKLPSFCQSLTHRDTERGNSSPKSCLPPSKILKDLGCVTPQLEKMPWAEARDSCRIEGSLLLGGVTAREHLIQLRDNFEDSFQFKNAFHDVWLGINDRRYSEHGGAPPPSTLWAPNMPGTESNRCGYVALQLDPPELWETSCTEARLPSFCQRE